MNIRHGINSLVLPVQGYQMAESTQRKTQKRDLSGADSPMPVAKAENAPDQAAIDAVFSNVSDTSAATFAAQEEAFGVKVPLGVKVGIVVGLVAIALFSWTQGRYSVLRATRTTSTRPAAMSATPPTVRASVPAPPVVGRAGVLMFLK